MPDLRALSAAAQARGIPVNIVDRPELCSFIMPAIVDRDPVTIAISSGGAAPVLARLLRQQIERLIPPAFGRLATLVGDYTAAIRRRLPDVSRRRHLLERLLHGTRRGRWCSPATRRQRSSELHRELDRDTPDEDAIGTVFLVGAGPGSADLLTLRAHRLLGEADVIVHDRLVGEEVLAMARRDARLIDVGKAPGRPCMPQEAINDLLIRLACQHRKVVRLKGGDPFIFGRGGEEAAALARAGVPFEVVPGVTAALACAAQARIPLTQRGVAALGHLRHRSHQGRRARSRLCRHGTQGGTLAIYMGLAHAAEAARRIAPPRSGIGHAGRPDRERRHPPPARTARDAG